jgi:hypothetical protein
MPSKKSRECEPRVDNDDWSAPVADPTGTDSEVTEEDHDAPEDPRAAVFYHIVALAQSVIEGELKNPRRDAVLEEFERRRLEIFQAAQDCETYDEQFEKVGPAYQLAMYTPVKLSNARKPPAGTDDIGLYNEQWRVKEKLEQLSDAWTVHKSRAGHDELRAAFPGLDDVDLSEIPSAPWEASVWIVATRRNLSVGYMKKRISKGRAEREEILRKNASRDESSSG